MGRPHRDDRRDAILEFIADSWTRRGHGPTHPEIAEAVGLGSNSGVAYHLAILAEAGRVERCAGYPGQLRVVDL